jgi:hypothetical protein
MPRFDKDPQYKRGKDSTGEKRQAWFQALNMETMRRSDAWVISTPHAGTVLIEVLPDSPWPAELRERGFPLQEIEGGQRILPHAVRVEMTKNADGTLAPLTPGSTQAVTMVVHRAGIHMVKRYAFEMP